jgi:hypothetical protein
MRMHQIAGFPYPAIAKVCLGLHPVYVVEYASNLKSSQQAVAPDYLLLNESFSADINKGAFSLRCGGESLVDSVHTFVGTRQ